jgi:hypothetical protein
MGYLTLIGLKQHKKTKNINLHASGISLDSGGQMKKSALKFFLWMRPFM